MKHKKRLVVAAALALCIGVAPLAACGHTHTGGTATCMQKAVCAECGKPYGELAAHSYVTDERQASCTVNGYRTQTCSVCHDVQSTTTPAKGHSYGEPVTHAATCTEDGYTTVTCGACNDFMMSALPASGHNYDKKEESVTCTEDGAATYTCKSCGNEYTEITVKSTGHVTKTNAVWTVKNSTPDADDPCNVHVVEATQCANCSEEITREFNVHKAVYTATVQSAASCTQKGEIRYDCSCGNEAYSYTAEIPVNANAHTWSASAKANATHECNGCGATKTEVEKTGTTATISAEELQGENVAIAMTDTQTTLQPDAALAAKMGGAEVKAETTAADSLNIGNDLKERIGDSPVYDFGMTKDGNAVAFDGGKMTVTVPYELQPGEDPTAITVLYIDGEGAAHEIDAVYVDGNAVFEAEHFSYYTVVRLTPAERCAKLGSHDYKDTVVGETCSTDGYTLRNCRRCGDHTTVAGNKATGHNYNEKKVAPTCTEKGYSIYTCSHCNARYISNYVEVADHDYTENVVAPTCTAKGYTEHVCADCGKQYKDNYTAAILHQFANGVCSVCGVQEIPAADNFYFNLIESIDLNAGIYLDMNDVTIEYTVTEYGDSADGPNFGTKADGQAEYSRYAKVELGLYRFTFRIDENDNLEAKGEGKATLTSTNRYKNDEAATINEEQAIKLIIKDGKVYTFNQWDRSGDDADGGYSYDVQKLDDNITAQFKAIYETFYTKELETVITAMQGQKNSPVNAAIAKAVEYLFVKTETDGGYTFTLETDRGKELITILTTESFDVVFDRVFGEGAYTKSYNWVYALPDKTVGELRTEILGWMLKTGVSAKDLYAAINSIVNATMPEGGEPFDVDAFLTAKSETKVIDLLQGETEMTAEQLKTMIASYGEMLTDENLPVADLVAQLAHLPVEGSVADLVAPFEPVINSLSAALKSGLRLTFSTDKSGTFLGFKADFTNFEFALDKSVLGNQDVHVKLNGCLNVIPGGDFYSDVNTVVTKLNNALETLNIGEDRHIAMEDSAYTDGFTMKNVGEYIYLIPDFNQDHVQDDYSITEGTYQGAPCIIATVNTHDSTYKFHKDYLSVIEHCTPWEEYTMRGGRSYGTTYKVYCSSADDMEVLGWEYDEITEERIEGGGNSYYTFDLYYNSVTDEFTGVPQHNYELIDFRAAECHKGGEGFEKYRCTVCGDTYTQMLWEPHTTETSYRLKGKTCEEGVIEEAICTVCHEVAYTHEIEGVWENGEHRTFRNETPIEDVHCGHLELVEQKCLCGQYTEDIYVWGKCEFDRITYDACSENDRVCEHGYHNHSVHVYRCAVTQCAYTYTVESYLEPTQTECVYTYHKIITLEDGSEHSLAEENYESHDSHYVNSKEGEYDVEKEICRYCDKVFWMRTTGYTDITVGSETFTVETYYYYTYEDGSGHGYEREYQENDPCHFVEYGLENGQRVDDGVPGTDHRSASTTREDTEGDILTVTRFCQCCNETVEVERYQIFNVTFADGATRQLSRLISYFDDENNGYIREYNDDCSYLECYVENGNASDKVSKGVQHAAYIDTNNEAEYAAPTCTQFGHYVIHCAACRDEEYVYLREREHSYVPTDDGTDYYCEICGMHNQTSADGPVSLESSVAEATVTVGYNNRYNRENVTIEIYVNNNKENMQRLSIDYAVETRYATDPRLMYYDELREYGIYDYESYGECGVITIDKAVLLAALNELIASGVEVKDVSVSVTVSGKQMPEDDYNDFIEQSVTFTMEELSGAQA